jgi:pyruvate/2-oxoacid:ferredoxin oxidoreductase beta subunit
MISIVRILDELAVREDLLSPGVSACIGCNVELTLRTVLKILGPNTILALPPGCMAGVGGVGWDKKSGAKVPVFHPLLDNTASMLAGIRLGFNAKRRTMNIVAFAGDGATVDAGFQALSGASERGDRIVYFCYDNEGYMNTGYQRSGSTSKYAWTNTTPVSKEGKGGKTQDKKDMPLIMAMHDIPYMATASPAYIPDLVRKTKRAMAIRDGLAYVHVHNPCVTGWGINAEESIEVCRLSVMSRYFPLYESRYRNLRITHKIKRPIPVSDYLARMGKFSHLTKEQVNDVQETVNRRYRFLEAIEAISD